MTHKVVLWRRLDTPGHDACRLDPVGAGWALEGAALFRHEGEPALLRYRVTADRSWVSQQATVEGWIGARRVELSVQRLADGAWTLDGRAVPEVEGCLDFDLGFTPATNLFQVRRLALADGEARDCPVAWLDVDSTTLTRLHQRYERRSATRYAYESPSAGYRATLELTAVGFVREYPELWELEETRG
jgi:uncharacterized protein